MEKMTVHMKNQEEFVFYSNRYEWFIKTSSIEIWSKEEIDYCMIIPTSSIDYIEIEEVEKKDEG
jgi:hypothetical protein